MTIAQPIGRRTKDLTGQTFGRWTVVAHAGRHNMQVRWLCVCNCGNQKEVMGSELRRGNSQSCGCLCAEIVSKITSARNTTHGRSNKGPYIVWQQMLSRCGNPAADDFKNYGGRGITVCARWQGRDGFANFEADMGPRPDGHSIERQRNDGNYEPGNCVWATRAVQSRNKRTNVWVILGGKRLCFSDACRIIGILRGTAQTLKTDRGISAQATIDYYVNRTRYHTARSDGPQSHEVA